MYFRARYKIYKWLDKKAPKGSQRFLKGSQKLQKDKNEFTINCIHKHLFACLKTFLYLGLAFAF